MNRWVSTAALAAVMTIQPVRAEEHAQVSLIADVAHYQPGKPFIVGIRMSHEAHWHSYWLNPGEGGFTTKWTWKLPPGWKVEDLPWPVPRHMSTGELKSYGYPDQVTFLAKVVPPADGAREARLTAEVSWLTCNEDQCVPGSGVATLSLAPGAAIPGQGAGEIADALKKIPRAADDVKLTVTEQGSTVLLKFSAPAGIDLAGAEIFPVTKQALSPAESILISATSGQPGGFQATVPKSEYADGPLQALELVLSGSKLSQPLHVQWKKD
jgi:DsbC/DsbD-like thiol-disulfide interchange protein